MYSFFNDGENGLIVPLKFPLIEMANNARLFT